VLEVHLLEVDLEIVLEDNLKDVLKQFNLIIS